MSEPCVIQADYANWRPVAGRKVLQLVFEVPIEQTADVMQKLGVPMPGESKWCAIALLEVPVDQRIEHPVPDRKAAGSITAGATTKERKKFTDLPLSQQAAMRCDDTNFQWFLSSKDYWPPRTEIADAVRELCGVPSRREIIKNTPAGDRWEQIEREYQSWRTDREYEDVRR